MNVMAFKAQFRWLVHILAGLVFILLASGFPPIPAQAQIITTTCETTVIYQPGVGIIPGSEITTCTSTLSQVADGSQLTERQRNSCGLGNPCPTAPPDTTDPTEAQCRLEQALESDRDKLANEIAKDIMKKRDWRNREYGAVIIRNADGELRTTELFRGSPLGGSVTIEFSISSTDTIVAVIHNHTNNNYNNATGPSSDDWGTARTWVDNGWAQASTFSEYLLSPGGSLAEFDYDEDFGKNSAKRSDRKDAQSKC